MTLSSTYALHVEQIKYGNEIIEKSIKPVYMKFWEEQEKDVNKECLEKKWCEDVEELKQKSAFLFGVKKENDLVMSIFAKKVMETENEVLEFASFYITCDYNFLFDLVLFKDVLNEKEETEAYELLLNEISKKTGINRLLTCTRKNNYDIIQIIKKLNFEEKKFGENVTFAPNLFKKYSQEKYLYFVKDKN